MKRAPHILIYAALSQKHLYVAGAQHGFYYTWNPKFVNSYTMFFGASVLYFLGIVTIIPGKGLFP